jgi:uroporphyrinogen decarboxylase
MPATLVAPATEHTRMARELVREMRADGGLAPLDVERFWADQKIAEQDPFGTHTKQVALGIMMSAECVFDELDHKEDMWRIDHDWPWSVEVRKAYNDKAEKIVGRRLIGETAPDPTRQWPAVKMLHDVFEAKNEWHGNSWWLQKAANDEDELAALLDRVEKRLENLREFMLPANWAEEKARLSKLGVKPPLYRGQRGPVTFATSIYGPEEFIFLVLDNPDLAGRLRDLMLRSMLGIAQVLDEEAGYTPATAPRGFGFCDDNCCLMTPDMYEFFGYPILKGIFARYAPDPKDWRYQHSDSAMGHLLPIFNRLDMRGVNFGPTLTVSEIRKHCRNAIIQGQLAPFTFSRNEEEKIVVEFLRDFEQAREKRGLLFATAGSINNGSRLTGMRLIMAAIQRYGRY